MAVTTVVALEWSALALLGGVLPRRGFPCEFRAFKNSDDESQRRAVASIF